MAKFDQCIDFVLANEGGYFEDKATGERSNFGITQKLLIAIDYFIKEPKELTLNDAKNIYLQQFWQKYRLDLFSSDKVARKIFDMMVNMGPREAILLVQRAIGFKPEFIDGILGHFTRADIEQWPENRFLEAVIEQSKKYYTEIATGDRAKFLNGWIERARRV